MSALVLIGAAAAFLLVGLATKRTPAERALPSRIPEPPSSDLSRPRIAPRRPRRTRGEPSPEVLAAIGQVSREFPEIEVPFIFANVELETAGTFDPEQVVDTRGLSADEHRERGTRPEVSVGLGGLNLGADPRVQRNRIRLWGLSSAIDLLDPVKNLRVWARMVRTILAEPDVAGVEGEQRWLRVRHYLVSGHSMDVPYRRREKVSRNFLRVYRIWKEAEARTA